jgi:RNA polymerase sigma-70 factor (ECF subfamily)
MLSSARLRSPPERLLAGARAGAAECLGELLRRYRSYLKLVASLEVDQGLQARFSASDIVQETLFDVYRDFGQFRGRTEPEFRAWLRQILRHNVAQLIEHHVLAGKRNARREVSFKKGGGAMGRSEARLDAILAGRVPTPSADARQREHVAILAEKLESLPYDHRQVLVLRHWEGLPFQQVAARMNRSEGAVRMLWLRALKRLRRLLRTQGLS